MFQDICSLLTERTDFFIGLCLQHLGISLVSIVAAIFIGGLVGIYICEVSLENTKQIPSYPKIQGYA